MAKNWAIAIGINEYEHLARPLQYAQRDAQLMRDWLQNRAGFEKVYYYADNSPKIGNTSTRPTRSNLLRLLDVRFQQPFMGAGDNFWFFFSGHGVRHEGQDYLMAADSYPENIPGSAIPVSYVLGQLRRCGADNIVLLLDACRDGGKSVEGMGRETAKQAQQMGVISIASCSPNELSYEVEALEQGVFTYALLEGLGVQGRCATVERLDAYLARRVPELNRQYGKRIQTPLTTAEPIDRAHLILVPEYATLSDVATLKLDAYRAAEEGDRELARRLWIRVLGASPADLDAVNAIERLAVATELPRRQRSRRQSKLAKANSSDYRRGATQARSQIPSETRQPLRGLWRKAALGLGLGAVGNAFFRVMKTNSPSLTIIFRTFSFEAITIDAQGKEIDHRLGEAKSFTEDINGVALDMVAIPGGSFQMGTENAEIERLNQKYERDWFSREHPQHPVTVQPFLMGKYPVTQAQWQAVANLPKVDRDLKPAPSSFKGKNRPVELVSWYDAMEFCQRLSIATGRDYRLPSEAEWEYACRARTTTPFHFGATLTSQLANYNGNYTFASESKGEYREQTADVGSFPPNAFGLYDMHGNVWEWCADDWHENYDGAPNDGRIWMKESAQSTNKMLRGGSWLNVPVGCRSAFRGPYVPADDLNGFIGFRVLCAANQLKMQN